MNVTITPALLEEKHILEHLMQFYQYDFTEFDNADANEEGLYPYRYLPFYWTESNRHPFLIRVNGKLAGFVLVRLEIDGMIDPPRKVNQIAEFFIMKKYRGQGAGEVAAKWAFDQFPGDWEVAQTTNNFPAQTFWHKTIAGYTQGKFQKVYSNNKTHHGPIQTFNNQ